jgi:hypothetical protein
MERAVVNRVVEDFIDVAAPLRHFTEAVNAPEGTLSFEMLSIEYAAQNVEYLAKFYLFVYSKEELQL